MNDTHDLALPAWATHVNSAKKERVQLQAKKALRRAKRDAVRQIGPHPLEPEVWTHDMIPGEWSCTLGACKSLYGDGRGTIIGSFQRGLNHLQTVHGFCGEDLDRFRQEWESLSHAIHEAETSKIGEKTKSGYSGQRAVGSAFTRLQAFNRSLGAQNASKRDNATYDCESRADKEEELLEMDHQLLQVWRMSTLFCKRSQLLADNGEGSSKRKRLDFSVGEEDIE